MDVIRTAEKGTNFELDWYLIDFARTTNTIDYGIKSLNGTTVELERIGLMPMPLDVSVTYTDGTTEDFHIPLQMMRGEKPVEKDVLVLDDWAWAFPTYSFILDEKKKVKQVIIDPDQRTADINRDNNSIVFKKIE